MSAIANNHFITHQLADLEGRKEFAAAHREFYDQCNILHVLICMKATKQ
jgi:hypothetical protein